jgi:6-phosphogluconolactonase (cycloisomerase 2 family)
VLIGLAGMATAAAGRSTSAAAAPTFMYIGSFTAKDGGHGEGLSVYHRNRRLGSLDAGSTADGARRSSFVIIDRQGRHLYAAHGDGTQATAYLRDQATGRLTVLNASRPAAPTECISRLTRPASSSSSRTTPRHGRPSAD